MSKLRSFTATFLIATVFFASGPIHVFAFSVEYDTTFSGDGYAVIDNRPDTSYEVSYAIAVQPDGKSIIVGSELTLGGTVKRFNVDGTADNSFGTNGVASFTLGSTGTAILSSIELQDDGKIIVSGYISSNSSAPSGWDYDAVVLRLTSGGLLDTTFSADGYEVFDGISGTSGNHDHFYDVAITADDKIVLVGESSVSAVVVRLTTSGMLDTDFDGDGVATETIAGASGKDVLVSVTTDSVGNIYATGYSDAAGTNPDAVVVKFTASGFLIHRLIAMASHSLTAWVALVTRLIMDE